MAYRLSAMHELAPILAGLGRHRPRRHPLRRYVKRAAVAVILREATDGAEALVIQRAQRPGDPWSGHVGLPGGRMESIDDGRGGQTAMRETYEELGLHLTDGQGKGRLSDILTLDHRRRAPLVLSPYVYAAPEVMQITPNHEVAGWQWLSLAWLDEPTNRDTLLYRRYGLRMRLPCYDCGPYGPCGQSRVLWGLTLTLFDELRGAVHRSRPVT